MIDEDLFGPLQVAMYRTVHDFAAGGRRGAAALGPRVGMHPGVLSNKVNPLVDTHHLTVEEAVAIQAAAGDCRIHEAEGLVIGRGSIPLGKYGDLSDVALLDAYSDVHVELGELAVALRAALADGRVTDAEANRCEREVGDAIQALLELRARVRSLVPPREAAHGRG